MCSQYLPISLQLFADPLDVADLFIRGSFATRIPSGGMCQLITWHVSADHVVDLWVTFLLYHVHRSVVNLARCTQTSVWSGTQHRALFLCVWFCHCVCVCRSVIVCVCVWFNFRVAPLYACAPLDVCVSVLFNNRPQPVWLLLSV